MAITRASAKGKGRTFQNDIRELLLKVFPFLEPDDIKTAVMGESGEDIKLSPAARRAFPYSVECKRLAKIAVYTMYEQAKANAGRFEPVVFMRADRKKALALVDADHFLELVSKVQGANT